MIVRGDFLKIQWKTLVTCLIIPLAIGIISALLTRNNMETFDLINKPFLAPPSWLFQWFGRFYIFFMGIASYLVFISKKPNKTALTYMEFNLYLIFSGQLSFSI